MSAVVSAAGPQHPGLAAPTAGCYCPTSWGREARGAGVGRSGVSQGLCPGHADVISSPSPLVVVPLRVSASCSPLLRSHQSDEMRAHLVTSSYLSRLCKDPVYKYGLLLRPWESGLQHELPGKPWPSPHSEGAANLVQAGHLLARTLSRPLVTVIHPEIAKREPRCLGESGLLVRCKTPCRPRIFFLMLPELPCAAHRTAA